MNINDYRNQNNLDTIDQMLCRNLDRNIEETVAEISAMTHIPILAVYYLVGEIIGETNEILNAIERLEFFYGVDDWEIC